MKLSHGILLIGILLLVGGAVAADPPNASFTANVTGGLTSVPVQFTDTSTNTPTSWSWGKSNNTVNLTKYQAYNVLLMHMNQTVGSPTTFVESSTGKTVTRYGDAVTTTSSKVLGNASGSFDGNGDYLSLASSTDFAFATGDFTVSASINASSLSGYGYIYTSNTGSNVGAFSLVRYPEGRIGIVKYDQAEIYASSFNISSNTWYNIVVSRQSGTTNLYINGVLNGSVADASNYIQTGARIGYAQATGYYTGYIDELVVWKGVAIPIAELYPQNQEFPVQGAGTDIFSTSQNPVQTFGIGNWSIGLIASNAAGGNRSVQNSWVNVSADTWSDWVAYGDAWKKTNSSMTVVMWNATGSHSWLATGNASSVDYLVVAGGGGGGFGQGGGGGAGGLVTGTLPVSSTISLTVGNLGTGATSVSARGASGSNSTFQSVTAIGGGGGGTYSGTAGIKTGANGGSGGGGAGGSGGTYTGGVGTVGQGRDGGLGITDNTSYGFGGGGGGNQSLGGGANIAGTQYGGAGGTGYNAASFGIGYVAGGGGGSGDHRGNPGTGGSGGSGVGGDGRVGVGYNAVASTGSGGGGGGYDTDDTTKAGGSGSSGVVIIRYNSTYTPGESIPTSSFSGTPTSGTLPLTVTFTDTSENAISWYWNFGDGNTSTTKSPTYQYVTAGTFSVNHSASSATNTSWTNISNYISITPTLVSSFGYSPTNGTSPLTVSFVDMTTGYPTGTSWNWSYQGVGTNTSSGQFSTAQNPTVSFTTGNFTITHGVASSDMSNISTQISWVNVSPMVASFVGTPTSGTVPFQVTFSGASTGTPSSWLWDFGEGNTSTLQNPTRYYYAPGSYTVSLTATNGGDSDIETKTNYIVASATSTTDLYMDPLPFTLTLTFKDSTTGAVIPIVGITDNLGYTTSTTVGILSHAYNVSNMSSPVVYVAVSSTGYITRQLTYEMTGDVTETVILTPTGTTPQSSTTWYVPKTIEFRVVNYANNQLPGVTLTAKFNASSTLLGGVEDLKTWYGMNPTAANEAVNGTLIMSGITDSQGVVVLTMLSTLSYDVHVTSGGTTNYFNVHPQNSPYLLRFIAVPTADTSLTYCVYKNGNTHTGLAAPDPYNMTLMWSYQDTCGLTTALDYIVKDVNNGSFIIYNYHLTPVTSGVYVNNLTLPNTRGANYIWYENATRSV